MTAARVEILGQDRWLDGVLLETDRYDRVVTFARGNHDQRMSVEAFDLASQFHYCLTSPLFDEHFSLTLAPRCRSAGWLDAGDAINLVEVGVKAIDLIQVVGLHIGGVVSSEEHR